MTYKEMMDKVINRFGFEDEKTIYFCEMIERIEKTEHPEYCKAMMEGFFEAIMK